MPRRLPALLLFVLLPGLLLAQRKQKAPIYADEALVLTKNLAQLRLPVVFYALAVANETYKASALPVLIGARYERVFKPRTGFGVEVEMNRWGKPNLDDQNKVDFKKATLERTIKLTPYIRFYMRSRANRRNVWSGVNIMMGPTIYNIAQSLDPNSTNRPQWVYNSASSLGLSFAPGIQFSFRHHVVAGANFEAIFAGDQFHQEGYYKSDIGSGAIYLNPFKFYIGARF